MMQNQYLRVRVYQGMRVNDHPVFNRFVFIFSSLTFLAISFN